MSYCRHSTNNFKCDLYIWSDVEGGWRISIRDYRRRKGEPMPKFPHIAVGCSVKEKNKAIRFMAKEDKRAYEPLKLPLAGTCLAVYSLEALKKVCQGLRKMGYRFPNKVFDRINEEIKERDNGKSRKGTRKVPK